MLLLETLITYLNIEQKKIDKLYGSYEEKHNHDVNDNVFIKYIDKNEKDTHNLPDVIISLYSDLKDYYYIKIKLDNNSFLYSLMSILDKDFIYCLDKIRYLSDLRKKLCYDLDEKNLYRIFNYVGKRNIKKDEIQKNLLDIDKEINEMTEKYISDYFGVNIYVFILEKNIFKNINILFATNDTDEKTLLKPSILLLKTDGYYKPIFSKNNKNILLHSDDEIVSCLYNSSVKKNIKNIVNKDVVNKDTVNKDTVNKTIKLPPLKKILIKDLQNIAIEYNVDIYKDKNGKKVYKIKNELYEEIKKMI